LVYSKGKNNAIGVINILNIENFKGVMAIVDADFWNLDGTKPSWSNILLTDSHDLETMLFNSGAFEKILVEFGSQKKIAQLPKPPRDILLENALPIGLLRWLSSPSQDNLRLDFKNLSFGNYLNLKTLSLDIEKLLVDVISRSQSLKLDTNVIKQKIVVMMNLNYDPWQVCSGHDLVEIFYIGLNQIYGNAKARLLSKEMVDGLLRIAYELSYFHETQLYKAILMWENSNPPFKIVGN